MRCLGRLLAYINEVATGGQGHSLQQVAKQARWKISILSALVRLGKTALRPIRIEMKMPGHSVFVPAIVGYIGTPEDVACLQGSASESAQISMRMILKNLILDLDQKTWIYK